MWFVYPFLLQGRSINLLDLGYKVQLVSTTATHARVHICRYTELVETNCSDGLDNDCNGLADSRDPACKK